MSHTCLHIHAQTHTHMHIQNTKSKSKTFSCHLCGMLPSGALWHLSCTRRETLLEQDKWPTGGCPCLRSEGMGTHKIPPGPSPPEQLAFASPGTQWCGLLPQLILGYQVPFYTGSYTRAMWVKFLAQGNNKTLHPHTHTHTHTHAHTHTHTHTHTWFEHIPNNFSRLQGVLISLLLIS